MRVLIIACTDINTDPRVQRQIKALAGHDIKTCGSSNADYDFYKLPPPSITRKLKRFLWLITGQFESFYWDDYKQELRIKLNENRYDAIIANDIYTLPLATKVQLYGTGRPKVYFDAHEYHPKEWSSLKWKLLYKRYVTYLCKEYIPKADSFSTVSRGLAREYKKLTGTKPDIVTNAAMYQNLSPAVVGSPTIELVHHGNAIPERRIEDMIKMMEYLNNHILYLMLVPYDMTYYKKLQKIKHLNNVVFLPPCKPEEICGVLNDFDIGVYILPPSNFNNINAMPNKIFDFIQARLALAVSPNPEMARMVKHYDLGVVAENYTPRAMAKAIGSLKKEDIISFKNSSHRAAKELSAESNYEIIQNLVSPNPHITLNQFASR